MIELPEALHLAAQMRQTFVGKRIKKAQANASPHGFAFYWGDPALYPALLEGKRITDVKAYGGRIALACEDMKIVFNDGVVARYYAPGAKLPEKHQLLLVLDDGGALVCTIQMYAALMACPESTDLGFYDNVALEKRSPLRDAFDEAYFAALLAEAGDKASAKAAIATEQRIPGLGNGCAQDILFRAGIHPKRKLGTLDAAMRAQLFRSVKETLAEMAEKCGRDTEKDLFGTPGGYRTQLSAKTKDWPCPVCGGPITRQAYLGGNVYFCAHCQPL